jgi:hypothetical protein
VLQDGTERDLEAGADERGKAVERIGERQQATALKDLAGREVTPPAARQAEANPSAGQQDRRDQQGGAEHVLGVDRPGLRLGGKGKRHGPHHRHPGP